MPRNITQRTRDRHLSPEEVAKYRKIRQQIEEEKPEINAYFKAQLESPETAKQAFRRLREIREAKGLSLRDIQNLSGIDASALSKLERGERENFTADTLIRYAQALGKRVTIDISDNS
jgi:predicted XRE-type DNA-binding protein